jgi:hypothetical protein
MQKRTFYLLGFFIILLLGSNMVLWAESNFCPDPFSEGKIVLDSPQEEIPVPLNSPSVPRNQVLLELGTGTW